MEEVVIGSKITCSNVARWNKLIEIVNEPIEVAKDILTTLALTPREYYRFLDSLARRYVKGNGWFGRMDQAILNNTLLFHPADACRAICMRGGTLRK